MSTLRATSLSEYRAHVAGLDRPSAEQVDNFVEFVSSAHSWYKHLPLFPPGAPFHFFVDPASGFDPARGPDGAWTLLERTDATPQFHYSMMTTEEYRHRFGYLQYGTRSGPSFFLISKADVHRYENLPVFYTPDGPLFLPQEVAEAGMVELTGVVHPQPRDEFAGLRTWTLMLSRHTTYTPSRPKNWPPESGGESTWRQIQDLLDRYESFERTWVQTSNTWDEHHTERRRFLGELETLVLPEVQRLHGKMAQAIQRVLDLVFGEEDE